MNGCSSDARRSAPNPAHHRLVLHMPSDLKYRMTHRGAGRFQARWSGDEVWDEVRPDEWLPTSSLRCSMRPVMALLGCYFWNHPAASGQQWPPIAPSEKRHLAVGCQTELRMYDGEHYDGLAGGLNVTRPTSAANRPRGDLYLMRVVGCYYAAPPVTIGIGQFDVLDDDNDDDDDVDDGSVGYFVAPGEELGPPDQSKKREEAEAEEALPRVL